MENSAAKNSRLLYNLQQANKNEARVDIFMHSGTIHAHMEVKGVMDPSNPEPYAICYGVSVQNQSINTNHEIFISDIESIAGYPLK